jgi:hypothetical protein
LSIDAIVVPSSRPAAVLRDAMSLAARLSRPLVVLCSRRCDAAATVQLAHASGVEAVAFDVTADAMMPAFATARQLAASVFQRRTDTSHKRNIGLLLARLAGWEQVMFLDDDVAVDDARDVLCAVGLLATYDRVGLSNDGYPDNSVVCHAYREIDGPQDTFVGGGALVVAAGKVTSFFPDIYNEDWFFLLNGDELGKVAVTGTSTQRAYDPFSRPDRAESQELGDCVAEGLFSLLDQGGEIRDADRAFWRSFLSGRRVLIDEISGRVPRRVRDGGRRARVESALAAARNRLMMITPEFCIGYVAAWRADCAVWRDHLERFTERSLAEDLRAGLHSLLERSHSSLRAGAPALAAWQAAAG